MLKMKHYEYTSLPTIPNPAYLAGIITRDVGVECIGIVQQHFRDTLVVTMARELTSDEKTMLDSIIASPPEPVSTYEYSRITIDDVEREVGIRPIVFNIDPVTGVAICHFDTTLTSEQETKLEALLRTPMKFKRRKP